ncbi:membrane metalloprotease ARASP, chloroplastic-like [Oryza glaberrima]|uniref:PDZ domain-containing protein n=2 Tax=Oryza TaxID=4527 RepID=A0A0D3FKQ3_9ORYZ|nr:membrane metalloprotease ARASP, chloroplastic-like [Oryza glaberrima]
MIRITTHLSPTLKPPPLSLHPHLPLLRRHRHPSSRPISVSAAAPSDLLASVESVASAASVLAAIVLVHESGHFLAATSRGIHVSQFSVGFGPALARFRLGPVEYALRAIPLGGYVGFPDDDPDSGFPPDDPDLLRNRPVPDRLLVVSAGVAANLLFAFLIVYAQALTVGVPVQAQLPGVLVPEVIPGSAAARAGLLPGDVILSVPGLAPDPSVPVLVDLIKASPNKDVSVIVSRTGPGPGDRRSIDLTVVPDTSVDGTGRIGVQLSPYFRVTRVHPNNLAEATVLALREFTALSATVLDGLRQTFLNFSQTAEKVSGPVAIIAVGAEVARSSAEGLFQFAAVINLNLAAINLLPLPALDGGTLALILLEAARGGQKIPREIEQRIMSSGILVVLMVGMFLIVRDTLNLDFIKDIL